MTGLEWLDKAFRIEKLVDEDEISKKQCILSLKHAVCYYPWMISHLAHVFIFLITFFTRLFVLLHIFNQHIFCMESILYFFAFAVSFHMFSCSYFSGIFPDALLWNSPDDCGGGWGSTHWTHDPGTARFA